MNITSSYCRLYYLFSGLSNSWLLRLAALLMAHYDNEVDVDDVDEDVASLKAVPFYLNPNIIYL